MRKQGEILVMCQVLVVTKLSSLHMWRSRRQKACARPNRASQGFVLVPCDRVRLWFGGRGGHHLGTCRSLRISKACPWQYTARSDGWVPARWGNLFLRDLRCWLPNYQIFVSVLAGMCSRLHPREVGLLFWRGGNLWFLPSWSLSSARFLLIFFL